MALERQKHDTPDALEAEFKNLDKSKENAFVWNATRAPNSSDKTARVWVFRDGTTLKLYLFDSTAGAWRGPTSFT